MSHGRIVLVAFVTMAMAATCARAQDSDDLSDPVVGKLDERVTRFLASIAEGNENSAFADLLLGSQLVEQAAAVRELVDRAKEIPQRYGAHRDSEQIGAKRVGKDLVLLKYLYKCEKFPVVWYLTFYRDFSRPSGTSDDQWVVIAVRFDTQLEALFD